MAVFTDQLNRKIEIVSPPRRIVSLVPSQTELLYDLGLDEEVAGITKFCIHPEIWYRSKKRIGGTKLLNVEAIRELKPDLIIGNKEENEQSQVELLMKEFPVWMSDIRDLKAALQMIVMLGAITHRQEKANNLKLQIEYDFNRLAADNNNFSVKTTAYFIWNDPMMVAGSDTFIDDLLQRVNLVNVFKDKGRYPACTAEQLRAAGPELILLSSEPFPFKEKHIDTFQQICPAAEIKIVDGELFSWYGSRLLQTAFYLRSILT